MQGDSIIVTYDGTGRVVAESIVTRNVVLVGYCFLFYSGSYSPNCY